MKKRIMALSMILTLVFGLSTVAYADDTTPTAVFDGSEEIKYNYQDTNNFGNAFSDMLPGEDRAQEIVLKNTSDKTVDFFMRTEVLKAFEDTEQRSNAAYQITLTVTQGSETITIYGGAEADGSVRPPSPTSAAMPRPCGTRRETSLWRPPTAFWTSSSRRRTA